MSRPLCSTATKQPSKPGWERWTAEGPDFSRSLELEKGLTKEQVGYYLGTAGVCDLASPLPLPETEEDAPPLGDISLALTGSDPEPSPPPTAISSQQLVIGGLGLLAVAAVALIVRWRQKPIRQRRPKNIDLGD